jgi:CBS domain-containing protein
MNAADVMVTKVITVGPDACVQDVANMLLTNRISAVPVVDANGKLLGIVSEGDLMRRVEAGTGRRRSWWLSLLTGREPFAAEYVKEHSRRVVDVMTRAVITAKPDTPLRDIANLLERNGIKRVPIVENGRWPASSAAPTCCRRWRACTSRSKEVPGRATRKSATA